MHNRRTLGWKYFSIAGAIWAGTGAAAGERAPVPDGSGAPDRVTTALESPRTARSVSDRSRAVEIAAVGVFDKQRAKVRPVPKRVASSRVSKKGDPAATDTSLIAGTVAAVENDQCASPTFIAGEGAFNFTNSGATMDGPAHEACLFSSESQIDKDVWYCWTAPQEPCDGEYIVSTCDTTVVDTKIAIYDGCVCPQGDESLLTCADDDCGVQTHARFSATPGQNYMIRVGTFPGTLGGAGTLRILCLPSPVCDASTHDCQGRDQANALTSNRTDYTVADDFTPTTAGSVSSVCWWGTYLDANDADCQGVLPDQFEVRYYDGADGRPGALLAEFSQALGTLIVDGPVVTGLFVADVAPEYEFSATHAPMPVEAGGCYWIEISNSITDCTWLWEISAAANQRAFQDGLFGPPDGYDPEEAVVDDLAFCVDVPLGDSAACLPPPPANDDCGSAEPLDTVGEVFFDNPGATLDGPPHEGCRAFGETQLDHDIWYCWTAPCSDTVFLRTCDLTEVDTRIAVYEGCACPPTDAGLLACNDDLCGVAPEAFQSMVTFEAVQGQSYLIRVGTFPGAAGGAGRLRIDCGAPDNAACATGDSCCQEAGAPGCSDETCCETVCACDPFCCEVLWDLGCATGGFQDSGCGAVGLCGCGAACGDAGAGDCCADTGTQACSDQACCVAVCECDPYCCDTMWDEFCAGEGSVPGCGAALLCTDLCAPECPVGTVELASPLDGVVDARRPHDPGDATQLLGISSVVVNAPTGADPECWTLCEDAVEQNTVTSVLEDTGVYTLIFDRPITPSAVTTVVYTDNDGLETGADLISHPANSNGVDTAGPTDVADLVGALAGTVTLPWAVYSEDIDHSGSFTPLDILEAIDLLNGAAEYEPWNDTAKPTPAPTCP